MLFLGNLPNIFAAEVMNNKAIPLTQNEFNVLSVEEQGSVDIHAVSSGGDDGLAIIGGVFLVLLLLAAIAADSEKATN